MILILKSYELGRTRTNPIWNPEWNTANKYPAKTLGRWFRFGWSHSKYSVYWLPQTRVRQELIDQGYKIVFSTFRLK